jgi:magnesium transporter
MKIANYFTPKSFKYSGIHKNIPTVITDTHYNVATFKTFDTHTPDASLKHHILVVGLSDIAKIRQMLESYNISSLIVEDVFNVSQRDKLEHSDNALFVAMDVNYLKDGLIKEDYFSALLTDHILFTFHETEPEYLAPIKSLLEKSDETRKRPVDYLFYEILDMITDIHLSVYETLNRAGEKFEEEILETKTVDQEAFYLIRKRLLALKNSVTPIHEQLSRGVHKKSPLIHEDTYPFFDDLIDHLARLDSGLYESREVMRHLLDLHINNQSHKMNQIMTTLTLFSAIFIPLSFLTGFFGMNFVHFEVLEYEHALVFFLGVCFLMAAFMVVLFKRMRWF